MSDLTPANDHAVTTHNRQSVSLCPCCGHPMISDQVGRDLPEISRRIYEVVRDAGSAGIGWREIMERVYAGTRDGAPDTNSVAVLISQRINPYLSHMGLKLFSRGGPGSVYRLVRKT